ncbi:uncharacterized protein [Acropora muricata]|uniref:uncharacterized protein n=1 Tax=Acropora muricata TaxID=159855 RepID=UPI0034E5B05E
MKNMNSPGVYNSSYNSNKKAKKSKGCLAIFLIVVVPILLCVILFLIFFFAAQIPPPKPYDHPCLASAEANRSQLTSMFRKIQYAYFHELHPESIHEMAGVTPEDIRRTFRPYDPSPNATMNRTDRAKELFDELNNLNYNVSLLKLRERKAIHVARAILRNNFGWTPLGQDYYNGDWLLGPDLFCYQPVCSVLKKLNGALSFFKPRNITELEKLRLFFQEYNRTLNRYVDNWKLGIRAGYVRNKEGCQAGLHAIKNVEYRRMTIKEEYGIYDEPLAKVLLHSGFFEHLSDSDNKTWKEIHLVDVTPFFNRSLVQDIAKPLVNLLRYLEQEHFKSCPSETYLSGLGKLPLGTEFADHSQPDGSRPTTQKLPTGQPLSGSKTFETLLKYFTTLEITPTQLREQASKILHQLYDEAVDIAKKYTGQEGDTTAISEFKLALQHVNMSFNIKGFPGNESDENAFRLCVDDKSAQAYCPERWKAMRAWIANTENVMGQNIRPVLDSLFHTEGDKRTIPSCPVDVVPFYHPYSSFHSYYPGSKDCKIKATQELPFFLDKFGPKWTEYTTTAHEQWPGHHLEVQSYTEFFQDDCNDAIHWLAKPNFFAAMTEGWAAYTEGELLPKRTNLYLNTGNKQVLLQKYGMIFYQILYALRTIVDIDINWNKGTLVQARKMYNKYIWTDDPDFVKKDFARFLSFPGISTSYMIGQLKITQMRDLVKKELGQDFQLKDFHYEVLRQGEYPLPYLEEHMRAYIACHKNPHQVGCTEFL